MKKLLFFAVFLLSFFLNAQAQEVWPLDRCIQEAIKNNLQILQSDISIRNSEINLETSQGSRFPNLNANTNYGQSFGRRIDPTTNSFIAQNFGNQSWAINSSVTLYNFNRINNSIQKAKEDLKISESEKEQLIRDISLSVAQAYLFVVQSKEQLAIAQKNKEQTQIQLDMIDKMIDAGARSRNSRLEIVAQVATNQSQIIDAENNVQTGLLNLKQLLVLDPSKSIDVQVPKFEIPIEDPSKQDFDELFNTALQNQPNIKAFEYRIKGAIVNEKIAASQGLPSLVGSAQMNTYYSTITQQITGFNSVRIEQPGVYINDQLTPFAITQLVPTYGSTTPYFNQLSDNLGYSIGAGLQIPIFNNNQVKSAKQIAKLNTESVKIQQTQAFQTLRSDILKSLTDAISAKQAMEAADMTLEALRASLNDTEKRFELGSANTFELLSAKAKLESASLDALIRKYNYIFNMKVLDYYAGKSITF